MRIKSTALAMLLSVLGLGVAETQAAQPTSVAYRLKDTKTMHFDDARKADLHLRTVRKLGCEARLEDHSGHVDVLYRIRSWNSLTLSDEQTAHHWESWMKKAGFETLHAHDETHDHSGHDHGTHDHFLSDGHFHGDGHDHGHASSEILTYSLRDWRTTHTQDRQEVEELTAVLKGLGCDVRTESHGDHDDVVFRCPRPKHVELPSHRVATGWENWMKRTGFQAEHSH